VNFPFTRVHEDYISQASFLHKIDWPKVWQSMKLEEQTERPKAARKERPLLKSLLAD
jgi:hypothetical protein